MCCPIGGTPRGEGRHPGEFGDLGPTSWVKISLKKQGEGGGTRRLHEQRQKWAGFCAVHASSDRHTRRQGPKPSHAFKAAMDEEETPLVASETEQPVGRGRSPTPCFRRDKGGTWRHFRALGPWHDVVRVAPYMGAVFPSGSVAGQPRC